MTAVAIFSALTTIFCVLSALLDNNNGKKK